MLLWFRLLYYGAPAAAATITRLQFPNDIHPSSSSSLPPSTNSIFCNSSISIIVKTSLALIHFTISLTAQKFPHLIVFYLLNYNCWLSQSAIRISLCLCFTTKTAVNSCLKKKRKKNLLYSLRSKRNFFVKKILLYFFFAIKNFSH